MVLCCFDNERPNPTLAELASATELSRPVVRRILLTLEHLGYVENSGTRWSLTARVLSIAHRYTSSHTMVDVAQPHLVQLAEETGESATLAVLDGTEVVYIARVPSRRLLSITASVGTRVPAHATSNGRVLLAWAPPDVVEQYLVTPGLAPLTPYTIVDPDQFRTTLAQVRCQGWSLVSQEREVGLIAVSAPVRDRFGTVVAAVSSSTSTGRSNAEQLGRDVVPVLLHTAEEISAELGYMSG